MIWNIRGLRSSESQQRLHAFMKKKQVKVLAILEPMIECDYIERRDLWASLLQVKPTLSPWLVGGDFNVVRDASECLVTRGGRMLPMEEFNTFILDSDLLDRVMVSVDWGDQFSSIRVEHLARTVSDHCPLLVTAPVFARGPSSFCFQRMWIRYHGFLQTVRLNWNLPCNLSGLPRLFAKLKRLKDHLKWWNQDVFGNIFDKILMAERAVRSAEAVCEADPSELNWASLSDRNEDLARVTAMEADFWKQKAACHWLEDGERNTKLFHNMVKKKRVTNKIFRIRDNEVCLTSPELIQQSGASFFQDLLMGEPSALACPDFSEFPSLISTVENDGNAATPFLEEVRATVFSIHPDSVAGPDGFSSAFFQHCWEIVHQDVYDAVLDFFRGSPLPLGFTATTITLISKVEGAHAWSDFRPISLCNVSNKIISKLLYYRLRVVVERLISSNQSGFVPGRMISDNILLAQELTHSLTLPTRGVNVILKLDMAKAYDRVQWSFHFEVLRHFGFSERVMALVSACISHCHFSININGSLSGFFGSTRGLRQGDPLSPILFILGAEYLSRGLDRLFLQHPTLRYRSGCDILISHLAYADDIIIFANGGSRGMQRLMDFLHHYENFSGSWLFSHRLMSWRNLNWSSMPFSGGSSLWARFLLRNYCQLDAPACVPHCGSISPTWHRLLRIPPRAEPGIRWRVGLGDVSFWDDIWFWDTPLSSQCEVRGGRDVWVFHFLSEGAWDFDLLCSMMAPSISEAITLIPISFDEPDLALWIHSSDGAFSVRSAWELVRLRDPVSDILTPCWGRWLRPTMSFFLWRLWHQWLSMDDILQRRGFHLDSRCQCCDMSETFTHVFIDGPIARTEFLPFIVLWFLWTARNDVKHRQLRISGETVKSQILSYLRLAQAAFIVKPKHWLGVFEAARSLGFFVGFQRTHRLAIVRWLCPPPGCFKLNIDGSSRGNPGESSVGGIVRDFYGRVLLSFSEFIGVGTNVWAELWAVLLFGSLFFSLFDSTFLVGAFLWSTPVLWRAFSTGFSLSADFSL
ncbi:uncharacterized protein LOC142544497 [Primulina tabacum]|uniref:uncharacterized protein LOC142544497 n=1 Tax=Primulina tabacum TaxID=48773 RepID=UPI003F5A5E74